MLLLAGGESCVATATIVKARQLKVVAISAHDFAGLRNMMVILCSRKEWGSDIAAAVVSDADWRSPTASNVSPYCCAATPLRACSR